MSDQPTDQANRDNTAYEISLPCETDGTAPALIFSTVLFAAPLSAAQTAQGQPVPIPRQPEFRAACALWTRLQKEPGGIQRRQDGVRSVELHGIVPSSSEHMTACQTGFVAVREDQGPNWDPPLESAMAHPAPARNLSGATLSRKSTSRPVEPAHAPQSFNDSPVLGLANPTSTKSEPMDIDPPTLDLRALSLNRTPGPSKASSHLLLRWTTTYGPPSPPPPAAVVNSEDDDMEDLYGPPLGLPPMHHRPHLHAKRDRRRGHFMWPLEVFCIPIWGKWHRGMMGVRVLHIWPR
ncbi:hypothetical protein BJV78DRAFT_1281948 [Lactifluus subvellereus]|nr:hypothetical protein BJV78DRAFT_1281948 [Lactifluus subvellereus]